MPYVNNRLSQLICCLLTLLACISAQSQTGANTLQELLKNKSYQEAEKFLNSSTDESLYYQLARVETHLGNSQFPQAYELIENIQSVKKKGDQIAYYYHMSGMVKFYQGDFELAQYYLDQALQNAEERELKNRGFEISIDFARIKSELTNFEEAYFLIKKAEEQLRNSKDPIDSIKLITAYSLLNIYQGSVHKADSLFNLISEESLKVGAVSQSLINEYKLVKARHISRSHSYEIGDSLFRAILSFSESYYPDEHLLSAICKDFIGSSLWNLGKTDAALTYHQEARDKTEKILGKKNIYYADAQNNVATAQFRLGKIEECLPLFAESKTIRYELFGDQHPAYSVSLNNLAFVSNRLAKYEEAEILYKEALAIREQKFGKEHQEYIRAYINLGMLYSTIGRYSIAEQILLESLELIKAKLGSSHQLFAQAHNQLAAIYSEMGNRLKAVESHEVSLKEFERILGPNHFNVGHVYTLLARLNHQDRDLADSLYNKSLSIFNSSVGSKKSEYYPGALLHYSGFLSSIGSYGDALKYADEAQNIYQERYGEEHVYYAMVLRRKGNMYLQSDSLELAEGFLESALAIYQNKYHSNHPRVIESLQSLAEVYHLQDKQTEALEFSTALVENKIKLLAQVLELLSENQSHQFKQNIIGDFYLPKSIALAAKDQKHNELLYNLILKEKDLLLNSSMVIKETALSGLDKEMRVAYEDLLKIKNELLIAYKMNNLDRIADLGAAITDREKQLARASAMANNDSFFGNVELEDLFQATSDSDLLIEFTHFYEKSEGTNKYLALIADPQNESVVAVPLFSETELYTLGNTIPRRSDYITYLYETTAKVVKIRGSEVESLYKLIWEPLEEYIHGKKRIHYSVSGILNQINLAALSRADGQLMIEDIDMRQYSSTKNLTKKGRQQKYSTAFLAGGINYDDNIQNNIEHDFSSSNSNVELTLDRGLTSEAWPYLSQTKVECDHISSVLEESNFSVNYLSGATASEERFKEIPKSGNSYHLVHLATHGYFFPDPKGKNDASDDLYRLAEDPMLRSGLIFAGANKAWMQEEVLTMEDGILTSYEIPNMDLTGTELVVLSACETGLGDIYGTEGVYGLQRAFKKAGVANLIMSLWKVPDEATADFMKVFYELWLQEGHEMSIAFQQAQITMSNKYDSPYYWAGFILVN